MRVKFFCCNPFQELCYVAWDEATRHAMAVDPGMCCDAEWNKVHRFLLDNELTLDGVLITHNHADHIMGTGYITRQYPGVPVYGSMEDQNHLPSVAQQNVMFGIDVEHHYAPISHNLMEGDELSLGNAAEGPSSVHRIQVLDCPGHSHHGLCYYFVDDQILFSGDVLFAGSVGRSDFGPMMGCNGPLLIDGIRRKLLTLPADVRVYPGHGMNTTIGYERAFF